MRSTTWRNGASAWRPTPFIVFWHAWPYSHPLDSAFLSDRRKIKSICNPCRAEPLRGYERKVSFRRSAFITRSLRTGSETKFTRQLTGWQSTVAVVLDVSAAAHPLVELAVSGSSLLFLIAGSAPGATIRGHAAAAHVLGGSVVLGLLEVSVGSTTKSGCSRHGSSGKYRRTPRHPIQSARTRMRSVGRLYSSSDCRDH